MSQLKKTLLIELIVFLFAILNYIFRFNDYVYILSFSIFSAIICFFTKNDYRDSRFQKDFILLIIISVLSYYILTYFLGFIIGFVYSTYSRRLLGILRNIVTSTITIIALEFLRERIVKSGKYYKSIIIIAIALFSFIETIDLFNVNILSSNSLILQFILSIFIPMLLKNILLTFLCLYSNKKITILYQLLMTLPNYILGVFPNLGDYINSTFQTIFPLIIMFFMLKIKDTKREKVENGRVLLKRKKISIMVLIVCLLFTFNLVYLVSGYGRYYMMAIGSESMTGVINKGDTVIIDKNNHNYKKGQVIAFKMEGKVIVHRIVRVEITDKGTFYKTKGDYNESEDGWMLTEENIIGCCILKIPIIGWPSVALSEIISR